MGCRFSHGRIIRVVSVLPEQGRNQLHTGLYSEERFQVLSSSCAEEAAMLKEKLPEQEEARPTASRAPQSPRRQNPSRPCLI